jgi:Zn-dependent protease
MNSIAGNLLRLILGLPGFLPGIILHELSHAVAADRLGDPTAKHRGRITLRPEAHIDPLGAIVYVLSSLFSPFAFGWAKPVPINPLNFRNPRRDFALSSLAGPVCNLLQIGVWAVLMRLLRPDLVAGRSIGAALFVTASSTDVLGIILTHALLINAVLCCFNLIPIPPLDGSRVLAYVLPERQAQFLDRLEPIGFYIVIMLLMMGALDFISPLIVGIADLFLRLLSLTT